MSKFKTGDIVRIVRDSVGYSENFIGQECEVTKASNGICYIIVTYKNGYKTDALSFNDSNLELVKAGDDSVVQQSVDEPVSKFKQGDEVVDILTGDVGVVVGEVIGEDSRAWDVKWKSGKITGSTCWQWEDQLELVGKYGYTPLQQDMQGRNVAAITESTSEPTTKITSTGGSSDYYKLNINGNHVETEDVIYAMVGGDFALGNALKALRRMYLDSEGGGKEGVDMSYDANKVKYFVDSFVKRFGG
jgi:hypothetical protein